MTDAPRVLVCGAVLGQPAGGVRRHNAELLPRVARELAERGGELCVLEGREGIAFELPDEVRRIATNVPAGPPLVRATLEGRWLRRVLREAREGGRPFDCVHTGHLPAPRHLGVPYSITIHDLRSLELVHHTPMSRRLFARGIVGGAVERAACVFTVSETVRASLLERFRLEPARVHVVPNAADHFEPRARCAGPDAPVLHVGHVEPRKNLELLVRALAVDPALPRVQLAGAPKGGHDEELRRLARELGVEERLELLGPFEEERLPELYASAACVALPSRLEGFGIAVLEAQRARVPVAVARAGALPEVAGPDAPTFDVDSPEECAAALARALGTSAGDLGASAEDLERGAENAARYSWDASAKAWAEAWLAQTAPGA